MSVWTSPTDRFCWAWASALKRVSIDPAEPKIMSVRPGLGQWGLRDPPHKAWTLATQIPGSYLSNLSRIDALRYQETTCPMGPELIGLTVRAAWSHHRWVWLISARLTTCTVSHIGSTDKWLEKWRIKWACHGNILWYWSLHLHGEAV